MALLIGAAGYFAYLLLAPGSPSSVTAVNDLGQTVVPLLVAAPAAAMAARRSSGRLRTSWWLLCAACAMWGLGQAVWTWFEVVLGEPVPYPGLADVGYLGCVPLLLAGVLVFPSTSLRRMGRARAVVDGLIMTSALLFASYGTFLATVYLASEGRFIERTIAVTYPVADVVTVAVVLAVLARRAHRLDGPLPIVAAGLVALAVADSAFAYMTSIGTYGADPVTDLGWPLGFAPHRLRSVAVRRGARGAGLPQLRVRRDARAAVRPRCPCRGRVRHPVHRRAGVRPVPRADRKRPRAAVRGASDAHPRGEPSAHVRSRTHGVRPP